MYKKLAGDLKQIVEAMVSSGPIRYTLKKAGRIHGIDRGDIRNISDKVFNNIVKEAEIIKDKYGDKKGRRLAKAKGWFNIFKRHRPIILTKQSRWYERAPRQTKRASLFKEIIINGRNTGKRVYFYIDLAYDDRYEDVIDHWKDQGRFDMVDKIEKMMDEPGAELEGAAFADDNDYGINIHVLFTMATVDLLPPFDDMLSNKIYATLKHELGHTIGDYLAREFDKETRQYRGKERRKKYKDSDDYKAYANSRAELDAIIYEAYDDFIDHVKKNNRRFKVASMDERKLDKFLWSELIKFGKRKHLSVVDREKYLTAKSKKTFLKKIKEGLVDAGILEDK